MTYKVLDHEWNIIGIAANWAEAKKLHRENLPYQLKPYYAGLDIQEGINEYLAPVFNVTDMPHGLRAEFGLTRYA